MKLPLSLLDKTIIQHLEMGGTLMDPVGKQLHLRMINKAMSYKDIQEICQRNGASFDDVARVYYVMVELQRPEIILNSGGPLLIATLALMEPFRLEEVLEKARLKTPSGATESERREVLIQTAKTSAEMCWLSHNENGLTRPLKVYAKTGLPASSARPGCAGMLLILLVPLSLLVGAVASLSGAFR